MKIWHNGTLRDRNITQSDFKRYIIWHTSNDVKYDAKGLKWENMTFFSLFQCN